MYFFARRPPIPLVSNWGPLLHKSGVLVMSHRISKVLCSIILNSKNFMKLSLITVSWLWSHWFYVEQRKRSIYSTSPQDIASRHKKKLSFATQWDSFLLSFFSLYFFSIYSSSLTLFGKKHKHVDTNIRKFIVLEEEVEFFNKS